MSVAIPLGCLGCHLEPATTPTVPKSPPTDVHYSVLYRDFETAMAYRGIRVRCRLDAADYKTVRTAECWEIHTWVGDRAALPVLIFQCEDEPPDGAIAVVGVCQGAERDGNWRSPRTDYRVLVCECRVSRR